MGETEPNLVEEAKTEMDEMLANVMPDSWKGHGRLKIAERGMSDEKRDFAKRVHAKLSERYPDTDSEALASKAVDMTKEKLN